MTLLPVYLNTCRVRERKGESQIADVFRSGGAAKDKYSTLYFNERELNLMPREIAETEEFIQLSQSASYCAIKRLPRIVKLKLRTQRLLYTLKTDPAKAEEIIKKLSCEIREV